jgi:hypothetical protein
MRKHVLPVAALALAVVAASLGHPALAVQKLQTTVAVAGAVNSTPTLAALGRTVVAVWSAAKDDRTNVFAAISNDGGVTFSEPRRVNDKDGDATANNEQPPRAVISGPVNARMITVIWSKRSDGPQRSRRDAVSISRSSDLGRTFVPARTIHDAAFSGARGWQSLAVSRTGDVHAVWLDGRDAERKMADEAAHSGMAHKGQPPQDVYHAVFTPDGRQVETLIATGVCFCCKTAVAVDARGAVYAAWRHIFPGSMRDIAFARSLDGGRHFEPLVRVSQDNWELNGCPEDGPAMAVDETGTIHVAWATLINQGEPQKAIFYAFSRDGKTFSARARVPTSGITPGHPQLVAGGGGVTLIWDETVDGLRRISSAHVSRSRSIGPAQVLSGTESASNPVIVQSGNALVAAWTSRDAPVIRLRRIDLPK